MSIMANALCQSGGGGSTPDARRLPAKGCARVVTPLGALQSEGGWREATPALTFREVRGPTRPPFPNRLILPFRCSTQPVGAHVIRSILFIIYLDISTNTADFVRLISLPFGSHQRAGNAARLESAAMNILHTGPHESHVQRARLQPCLVVTKAAYVGNHRRFRVESRTSATGSGVLMQQGLMLIISNCQMRYETRRRRSIRSGVHGCVFTRCSDPRRAVAPDAKRGLLLGVTLFSKALQTPQALVRQPSLSSRQVGLVISPCLRRRLTSTKRRWSKLARPISNKNFQLLNRSRIRLQRRAGEAGPEERAERTRVRDAAEHRTLGNTRRGAKG
jgi:hypothetical protein